VHTQFTPTKRCTLATLEAVLGEMAGTGRRLLAEEHVDPTRVEIIEEAELCYVGQSYPLRIRVPADRRDVFDRIEAEFHRLHRDLYGVASPGEATMIVNLRVTALGKVDRPRLRTFVRGDGDPAQARMGRRLVDLGGDVDCPIYEREWLDAGDIVAGPAIID